MKTTTLLALAAATCAYAQPNSFVQRQGIQAASASRGATAVASRMTARRLGSKSKKGNKGAGSDNDDDLDDDSDDDTDDDSDGDNSTGDVSDGESDGDVSDGESDGDASDGEDNNDGEDDLDDDVANDAVEAKSGRDALKNNLLVATSIFETACSAELTACGWTGGAQAVAVEDVAVKSLFAGAKQTSDAVKEQYLAMRKAKDCLVKGRDKGTTGDACLAAMSDLQGLKDKPAPPRRPARIVNAAAEALQLEREAIKEVIVGLKEDLQAACAAEFAECHTNVGYDLTAAEKAALSYEDKVALKKAMYAAKECMATVFNTASGGCVNAKKELDTAMTAARPAKPQESNRGKRGKVGRGRTGTTNLGKK